MWSIQKISTKTPCTRDVDPPDPQSRSDCDTRHSSHRHRAIRYPIEPLLNKKIQSHFHTISNPILTLTPPPWHCARSLPGLRSFGGWQNPFTRPRNEDSILVAINGLKDRVTERLAGNMTKVVGAPFDSQKDDQKVCGGGHSCPSKQGRQQQGWCNTGRVERRQLSCPYLPPRRP